MLSSLYIENIAVIEKTNIDLTQGLNVLTGETGAGKSIVIDSINAVLGQRTSKELIRTGATEAFVSACFTDISESAAQEVLNAGFTLDEDNTVILQREISQSGRSTCRINGRPATVGMLKAVGTHLINIHGQHESYELMSPELHINYIDNLGELADDLHKYREAFAKLKKDKAALSMSKTDVAERERRIDLLRYQIDELNAAQLRPGELDELNERKAILLNSEKINKAIMEARACINGDDENDGALQALERASARLLDASAYYADLEKLSTRMRDLLYELEDCGDELSGFDDFECDTNELEDIEQRLDLIYKLSRKYGETVEDMLEFLDKATKELQTLEDYEFNMDKLEKNYQKSLEVCNKLAKALSDKRRRVGKTFAEQVKKQMVFLDMPGVELVVSQEKCELNEFGCDTVELLISTNPGEPPKPVSKIASGGELSRMMLAIKNVLADKDDIDTLIFDEVDTGISGSAAHKVGLKLKEVSQNRQVICVTHQTQIASLANTHFLIKKNVKDGRTFTSVKKLDYEERKQELARIIGGVQITDITLKHADEMLKMADIFEE
ncbi:MAG: DNA repair protein RecN [Acutalibacteraceae bacterium]